MCIELNICIVVVYLKEDFGFYYWYKVDEVYLVGEGKKLIDVYLDIEGIIDIVKRNKVDVIYLGYGFLFENIYFVRWCEEEGIVFIGLKFEYFDMFGDKVKVCE